LEEIAEIFDGKDAVVARSGDDISKVEATQIEFASKGGY